MDSELDRRTYVRALGAAALAAGLAGCTGDGGDGSDGTDDQTDDAEAEEGGDGGDGGNGGNETDDGGDGGDEVGPVTAGTAPGFPPFEMTQDGELVGFDIDLLEAVLEEAGVGLEGWEEFEFDSLIPALQNENIDVIAAAMTITEERQQEIAFSDPYYSADQSVLVASGGEFQPESFEDFEGAQVGAQSGTTGESVVQSQLIDAGIIDEGDYSSYDNYVLAVQDLERGVIDAIVIDEPVGRTFESERDVEVAFVHETDEEFGFGVRQGEDALVQALNEGIAAVQESGRYEEITSQWFGE